MPLKVSGSGPAPAGCSARHGGCAWIQHIVPGAGPRRMARENLDEAKISDHFSVPLARRSDRWIQPHHASTQSTENPRKKACQPVDRAVSCAPTRSGVCRWTLASRVGCWPSRGEGTKTLARLALANDKPESADGRWPWATWNVGPAQNLNPCSQSIRVLVDTIILQLQGTGRKKFCNYTPKNSSFSVLGGVT